MPITCPSAPASLGFVRGLLTSVDCNVRQMSEAGYHAVSAPGSQLEFALTSLLTIYVAAFGLRLMLGLAPLRIGDLTVSSLKVGLVLALTTSWQIYDQLIFGFLFRGPEQIAASMMAAIQPTSSILRGNPFDGLQIAFDQLQAASAFFARISQPAASPLSGGPAFAAFSLNSAAYLLAFSTVGVVLAAKIVLGLLLATGPVFVALLLFESTRGVFEGWLRAAIAFSLIPLFASLALVAGLALLEPSLEALSQMRATGEPDLPAAAGAFMLIVISSLVSVAGIAGVGVVAVGLRLPKQRPPTDWASHQLHRSLLPTPVASNPGAAAVERPQPRVAAISAAAIALDRLDQRRRDEGAGGGRVASGARPENQASPSQPYGAIPGRPFRRSAQPRRTASNARRDR